MTFLVTCSGTLLQGGSKSGTTAANIYTIRYRAEKRTV